MLSEYPYLLMLIKLWPGGWQNQLEIMNMSVDDYNGRDTGMVKGRIRKFWKFSSNEFWKNIGCLISDPTFVNGDHGFGSNISNKR